MSTTTMTDTAVRLMIRFADPEAVGTGAETTWAVAADDGWRIDHPLWWTTSVGYGDTVRAVRVDEDFVVAGVVARGGWSTCRVTFPDVEVAEEPLRKARFTHNAVMESYGQRRWACAVPAPAVGKFERLVTGAGGTVEWTVGPSTPMDEVDFTVR